MTLATLAIHAETWLQEELGAERALLSILASTETAARAGKRTELERGLEEAASWLGASRAREARRSALLERLAAALAVPSQGVSLTRLSARLQEQHIDTQRLDGLRKELRGVALDVARASRKLAAMAQYHRGLLEELCQLFVADPRCSGGHLVDARG